MHAEATCGGLHSGPCSCLAPSMTVWCRSVCWGLVSGPGQGFWGLAQEDSLALPSDTAVMVGVAVHVGSVTGCGGALCVSLGSCVAMCLLAAKRRGGPAGPWRR